MCWTQEITVLGYFCNKALITTKNYVVSAFIIYLKVRLWESIVNICMKG